MRIGKMAKRIVYVIEIGLTIAIQAGPTAFSADARPHVGAVPAGNIAPGTIITMANWQQYRTFMPDGMAALFEGKYFWKMPSDVQIEIGSTVIHPLPRNYLAATEKFSPAVRLVELPNGGLTIQNYRGGIPFPNPAEPHKGWKTLANVWYRYIPHLSVDTYGSGCAIDATSNYNCQAYVAVKRQLAYNTDPGAPAEPPGPNARYFTEWFMTLDQNRKDIQHISLSTMLTLPAPKTNMPFFPLCAVTNQFPVRRDVPRRAAWMRPSRTFTTVSIPT